MQRLGRIGYQLAQALYADRRGASAGERGVGRNLGVERGTADDVAIVDRAAASAAAVPRVATRRKPNPDSVRATSSTRTLSAFLTLTKTLPWSGSLTPAATCDLRNASANDSPTPMTSPVDFISGPRIVSTPGNLMNGNTASLTAK